MDRLRGPATEQHLLNKEISQRSAEPATIAPNRFFAAPSVGMQTIGSIRNQRRGQEFATAVKLSRPMTQRPGSCAPRLELPRIVSSTSSNDPKTSCSREHPIDSVQPSTS